MDQGIRANTYFFSQGMVKKRYNDKYPIEKVQNLGFFISHAISTVSTNVRTLFIIFFLGKFNILV